MNGVKCTVKTLFSASLMPALNAQSAILDICREFSESRTNRKVVPSTPRLSFWTVLFRHNPEVFCNTDSASNHLK